MTRAILIVASAGLTVSVLPHVSYGAGSEHSGELSVELAFDRLEFRETNSLTFSVAPSGREIAYVIRDRQPDVTLAGVERFRPNGTPVNAIGSKVFVVNVESGVTDEVCPASGANSWRPVWSPDGRMLAVYSDAHGSPQLWLYDAAEKSCRKGSDDAVKAKIWIGDEPQWSPDSRWVYVPVVPPGPRSGSVMQDGATSAVTIGRPAVRVYVAGREKDHASIAGIAVKSNERSYEQRYEEENASAHVAVDVSTGKTRTAVSWRASPHPNNLRLSASGRWLSYLSVFRRDDATVSSAAMDLAVVPSEGGAAHVLVSRLPLLVDDYDLSSKYYSWHPSDDKLVYVSDGGLWLVRFGADGPSPPRRLGAKLGELAPDVHWFTRDGRSVVVRTARRRGKSTSAEPGSLAIVPMDGSDSTVIPIQDGSRTLVEVLRANATTVWQPDDESIYLLWRGNRSQENVVTELNLVAARQTVVWKGRGHLRILKSDAEHSSLIGLHEDYDSAPGIVRFSSDFSTLTRITTVDARLDEVGPGQAERFETVVPTHDGSLLAVHSSVLLPPGSRRGDRLPAIVLFYPGADLSTCIHRFGGGDPGGISSLLFTSRGFAVLCVDVPIGPGDEPGNIRSEITDAILPQVYRAADLGYVDINRIGIMGQSFGGYGAAAVISQSNVFRAAVAISGFFDLASDYGHMTTDGRSDYAYYEDRQPRMGRHPWADLRRYIENSPYHLVDRIHTPLLLVHGEHDIANHVHESEKLFAALRRLDRTAHLAVYAGEGHHVPGWKRRNAVDAAARILSFFDRHLRSPPAQRP